MVKYFVVLSTLLIIFVEPAKTQNTAAFEKDLDKYASLLKLPTLAVGVAQGDNLIFFKGVGFADSLKKEPISKEHIFTIASITKSFTAAVLESLEAEGKLSLSDPVDKYPNKYFTKERWDNTTTLAHIISQTAESEPPGNCFVYNGSKYNVVFNAFSYLNKNDSVPLTRPFTKEIEKRILEPLGMTHTLAMYREADHASLKPFVVPSYNFDKATGRYTVKRNDISKMESGPGYGMMSSVADLVKYSNALDKGQIISKERYKIITTPFYKGSPYGMGWFTTLFEGLEMHWAYGYGNNDAALVLKIPAKNLTLVLLSSCDMPSATLWLGYGNPLNSPVVTSFIRNFVLHQKGIDYFNSDIQSTEKNIAVATQRSRSRIFVEESYAYAQLLIDMPSALQPDTTLANNLLEYLVEKYPNDPVWGTPSAFELYVKTANQKILQFALGKVNDPNVMKTCHPFSIYLAGQVNEKMGKIDKAMELYRRLASGDSFREQGAKFGALLKLGKYYKESDAAFSKTCLEKLVRFKEYIGAKDDQYKEAKKMLEENK